MRYLLSFLIIFAINVNAEIYKWVDDKGVTHYGSEKPKDKKSSTVEVIDTPQKKEVPQEVKEVRDGMAQAIMKDNGNSNSLNCDKAVSNAKEAIDLMLSTGEKNVSGGYVSSEEFQSVASALTQIKSRISKTECESSTGNVREFYLCVANDDNHVAMCGSKYKYGG